MTQRQVLPFFDLVTPHPTALYCDNERLPDNQATRGGAECRSRVASVRGEAGQETHADARKTCETDSTRTPKSPPVLCDLYTIILTGARGCARLFARESLSASSGSSWAKKLMPSGIALRPVMILERTEHRCERLCMMDVPQPRNRKSIRLRLIT